MSTTAGYFDETILTDARVLASSMMLDDRIKQQFIPNFAVIKAIQAVEAPNLKKVFKNGEINDVEIIWENACGLEVEDNTSCSVGGTKLSTNKKSYSLSYKKIVDFSLDENDYIDNDFGLASALAKAMLRADMLHAEAFAQYCVAQLNAFAGQNEYTAGKGTVAGLTTTIPAAFWDSTIMAYLNLVSIKNKFTSPIYATGDNLYESIWVAKANAGNADGKGEPTMWGSTPIFFDLFNIDAVNAATRTYMLSQNSLAFASRTLNPKFEEIPNDGYKIRWTEKSRFLPFTYDVYYDVTCTGDDDLLKHDYKIKLTADLFRNPIGCTELNHGILTFDCV